MTPQHGKPWGVVPRPTTPTPSRPACGPSACPCADCGARRAGRVLAERAALSAAQLAERVAKLRAETSCAASTKAEMEQWIDMVLP